MLWGADGKQSLQRNERKSKAGLKKCFEHTIFPVFLSWTDRGFRDGTILGLFRCDMGRRGMKRKKKDLNQHSWKVHILQFLTVGFALWSWWETAAGVNLTQKLPQDQTERWMAVLLMPGFLQSVWLGSNAW